MSLSARRAWIEICVLVVQVLFDGSLSARRAWIEIAAAGALSRPRAVALRKESVDRNTLTVRNCSGADLVALRKESVDRNCPGGPYYMANSASLSARRAWIEIMDCSCPARVTAGRSPQGERG